MDIKTVPHPLYSPDLAPCDFGYSQSSEVVVMRQLRRWKRLWRRSLTRSHKRTPMGPCRSCWNGTTSALQEITSKGTRVSCVYYQLKCPYEKSLETYLMTHVNIWVVHFLRSSGPFLKWSREELRQVVQKTRKLMKKRNCLCRELRRFINRRSWGVH